MSDSTTSNASNTNDGDCPGRGGDETKTTMTTTTTTTTMDSDNHSNDTMKKQGAYGKVKTHQESKFSQLLHFDEIIAAITLLYIHPLKSNLQNRYIQRRYNTADLTFCDDILVKVSRSFAAVIRQLPSTLLVDVAVFYLVLRALDTIEDDMEAFDSHSVKVQHLTTFHEKLGSDTWCMDGVGLGDEKLLLQKFYCVNRIYNQLPSESKVIIHDITQRMAEGMSNFVTKELGQGTENIDEYNRYCHYVAGLVGEGLSRLFSASGLERPEVGKEIKLADQMGLFLQKTNIIRDFLEDYVDKRAFWPQSVWKKYSKSGELGYFIKQSDATIRTQSLCCLNELVTDALELVPDCLQYMSQLRCVEIFRFCAIPQVMAIATLDRCYHNTNVFTGVVKIRKGLSCKLILRTNNMTELCATFVNFALQIKTHAITERSNGFQDPNFDRTIKACDVICAAVQSYTNCASTGNPLKMIINSMAMFLVLILAYVWKTSSLLVALDNWVDLLLVIVMSGVLLCFYLDYQNVSNLKETNLVAADLLVRS